MRCKKSFIIFFIALILLNLSIIFATNANNNNISNFFRIHVVANSDSIDDQLLKYKIAKQIDEYISCLTVSCESKQETKEKIESNIQKILSLCNSIIEEQGYNYNIKAYLGKIEYSEKQKDNIYMSSGIYDSLKIIIGNGNGNNWWSLIYPTTNSEFDINELKNDEPKYSLYIIEWIKALLNN